MRISDLGVIEDATLEFSPGFTVVTGETGAGKTMVVTALTLILGARADQGAVRSGALAANAEGRFEAASVDGVVEAVDAAGGQLDGTELILSRRVGADGRSRAFAGGRSVPAGVLADVGARLVAIHGQNDQTRLVSSAAQRELLDGCIGAAASDAIAEYGKIFAERRESRRKLAEITADRDVRAREAEELRRALDDIAAVSPKDNEDVEIDERIARLAHSEELRRAVSEAAAALTTDVSSSDNVDAIGLVEVARKALDKVAGFDEALAALTDSLTEARYALEDVNAELATYSDSFDAGGPGELEAAQERHAQLRELARKYGPTLADVKAFDARGVERLLELESDDETVGTLQRRVSELDAQLDAAAVRLTEVRQAGAASFAEAVTAELAALAMPGASIHIAVTELDDFTATGRDKVEILLQPHSEADPRPLAKAASGGELSRVMLAIEVVAAGAGGVPTYIFDEVDAGVGGAAAIEIGRRLAKLSTHAQVIAVTHLAQVAAFADTQLQVSKDADGGYTSSSVTALDDTERVAELARMLSGLGDSATGLAHARELLELARGERR